MFSELKALIDSEIFRVIVFQYRAKNNNSELGIFTSKHDSTCHKKIRVIVFMHRAKNDNSELGIHLRTNSEISEIFENSELSLWPPFYGFFKLFSSLARNGRHSLEKYSFKFNHSRPPNTSL